MMIIKKLKLLWNWKLNGKSREKKNELRSKYATAGRTYCGGVGVGVGGGEINNLKREGDIK